MLKSIGAALYVCEGTKARRDYRSAKGYIYSIELTNSNPNIIRLFSRFLKKIIKADWKRMRGQLFIYPDLQDEILKEFWANASGVPIQQFQKSIILKSKEGKFKANPNGTFKIRYSSKEAFLQLEEIIVEFWKQMQIV